MSEGSKRRSKRCKVESRASKNPAPSKRRRRAPPKRVSKESQEPEAIASIFAEPPMQFSIRIEVETCDDDWGHEEETLKEEEGHCKDWKLEDAYEETNTGPKQFLGNRNPSNNEESSSIEENTETGKSNKLKFAYLEALHQNSVLDKLEESSNQLRRQRVTELENLESLGNKMHGENFKAVCIKKEVPDEDLNDEGSSENLTEYLGITIKEECLQEPIYHEQAEADIRLCLKKEELTDDEENSMEMVIYNDVNEEGVSESAKPVFRSKYFRYLTNYLSSQYQGEPDTEYGSRLPSWHVHSRYFDLALNNILECLHGMPEKGLKFDCGLCGQTYHALKQDSRAMEACVQDILTHLNYDHLDDALVLSVVQPFGPCTILAEKVNVSDKSPSLIARSESHKTYYAEIITAARVDLQLTKSFLQSIVNCLLKCQHKRAFRIVSYKCYMCKLCYEYLGHYVDHLKTKHAERDYWRVIKFSTETVRNCFVSVKAFKTTPKYEDFPVITEESNKPSYKCLLCKLDFISDKAAYVEHKDMRLQCSGCRRSYHCHQLHAHIGRCNSFFQRKYPKTCPCKKVFSSAVSLDKHQSTCLFGDTTLAFNCLVCSFVATTEDILQDHQWFSHTVRSDEFVFSETFFEGYRMSQEASSKTHERCSDRLIKEAKDSNSHVIMMVQSDQQAHPLGFNTNTQPTTTKTQRKIPIILKSVDTTSLHGITCPICPFRQSVNSETLKTHMVICHLVRSDIKVKDSVTCRWCSFFAPATTVNSDEALLKTHTAKYHRIHSGVLRDISCSIGDVCLICYEILYEEPFDYHLETYHKVRSDELMYQNVTRCELCMTLYPGPVGSHHCPKKLDVVCCFYCRRQFQNNHFLDCHLKGYKPERCTNCHQELKKGCMRARHEAYCCGDRTVVHECLKCGFKDDEVSAIDAHCVNCFTTAERTHRVFFSKELLVPKISVSTDPIYDHSYVKGPITPMANESVELTAQISNDSLISASNILCTEVYEEVDSESTTTEVINDDKNIAISKVTSLQQVVDSNVTKNATNVSENYVKELRDDMCETDGNFSRNYVKETSKVDDLEDIVSPSPHAHILKRVGKCAKSSNNTVAASSKEDGDEINEVPEVMSIKSEPMDDEELFFVVTKTTELDAELSIEDFIENNFEIADTESIKIEPEVLITSGNGVSQRKKPNSKMYTCIYCLYKGNHRNFRTHIKSCRSVGKTQVNLTSLPYNCLDYCESFKCYVCWAEHPTVDEYFTHKCKRIGSCPCCRTHYRNVAYLKGHLQSVMRKQYGNVMEQTSGKSFACVQCAEQVATSEIFNHWAEHRTRGDASVLKARKKPVKIEPDYCDIVPETDNKTLQQYRDIQLKAEPDFDVPSLDSRSLTEDALYELLTTLTMHLKNRGVQAVCKLCEKACNRNHEFKIHLIQHLLSDAYSKKKVFGALRCQICSQEFNKPPEYKMHMRNHADLPLYQCPRCDKTFSDCSNLAKHRKVHNLGVKICDHCNRKFHCKFMLIRHLELHEKKPLVCPHCPATFLYQSDFRRHVNSRHNKQPQCYGCSVCKARLVTMKDKWDHEWHEHGLRKFTADCAMCGAQFRRIIDLKKHLKTKHKLFKYSDIFACLPFSTRCKSTRR